MRFPPFAAAVLAVLSIPAAPLIAQSTAPVPVEQLVAKVDIPYQTFTLANGLRVIVSTDRKAPVVAVSIWYDVGSKHEPAGKTGFAHLFELLPDGADAGAGTGAVPGKRPDGASARRSHPGKAR